MDSLAVACDISEGARTGGHSIFVLHAHLVFVTKSRHKVFTDRHLTRLEEIMRAMRADFETKLVEFNGEAEHVHLLVNFPPKAALSKLPNRLKGVSSWRIRHELPDLARYYYRTNSLWSASYFAGSVGSATLDRPAPIHQAAKPAGLDHPPA